MRCEVCRHLLPLNPHVQMHDNHRRPMRDFQRVARCIIGRLHASDASEAEYRRAFNEPDGHTVTLESVQVTLSTSNAQAAVADLRTAALCDCFLYSRARAVA